MDQVFPDTNDNVNSQKIQRRDFLAKLTLGSTNLLIGSEMTKAEADGNIRRPKSADNRGVQSRIYPLFVSTWAFVKLPTMLLWRIINKADHG